MNSKIAIALVTTLMAGSAWAAGDTAGSPMGSSQDIAGQFDRLDANRDGYISKSEAAANPALKAEWSAADANGNDKLEMSEFAKFQAGDQVEE